MKDTINFRDIPGTSRLLLDYLYDFEKVERFYRPADIPDLVLAGQILQRAHLRRVMLKDILIEQNRAWGASTATMDNLELLGRPGTIAVVTGQQAGLFTGPLYTIYKAITVLKLVDRLRSEGIEAVPVFWVASEDHDWQEVNHCSLVDSNGALQRVVYSSSHKGSPSVGHLALTAEIEGCVEQVMSLLPQSEFIKELRDDLRDCYRPGRGFADAFAALMMRFFSRFGLVMLNPLDPALRRMSTEVFCSALTNCETIVRGVIEQSQQLIVSGYHAQVYVTEETVPLFIYESGNRSVLQRAGERFVVKQLGREYGLDELLRRVEENPESFSPSVILRPVVQDTLLPTLIYAGGPAEIAYFGQLLPVYNHFQRTPPRVALRGGATLLSPRTAELLNRYGLSFSDLRTHGRMTQKVVEQSLDKETAAIFQQTEEAITVHMERLRKALERSDKTLAQATENSREKILYQINNLRHKFVASSTRREETLIRQLERTATLLQPEQDLQERFLNVFYFLARFGYEFIDRVYDALDPSPKEHQLLQIV